MARSVAWYSPAQRWAAFHVAYGRLLLTGPMACGGISTEAVRPDRPVRLKSKRPNLSVEPRLFSVRAKPCRPGLVGFDNLIESVPP